MSDAVLRDISPATVARLKNVLEQLNDQLECAAASMAQEPSNSPLDRPLRITFFGDKYAYTKREEIRSLRELGTLIKTLSASSKAALPLLKLAPFGKKRTKNRSLRHDANVLTLDGIEGDYDGMRISFDEASERLKAANVAALIYTSPRHSPAAPRWRVLCPLSKTQDRAIHTNMVARLNGILGGALGRESFILSQSYYYGSVNANPAHRVGLVDGIAIDLADNLDAIAVIRDGQPSSGVKNSQDPFVDDVGPSHLGQEADPEIVADALACIPNDGKPDWNKYTTFLMAVWAATGGSDEGREAALAWSEKNVCHETEIFEDRWAHFLTSPPSKIGAGTIIHIAKQYGWQDPRKTTLTPLCVHHENLPKTAIELAASLATRVDLFDRGVPVRLAYDTQRGGLTALPLTLAGVVREVHMVCEPYVVRKSRGEEAHHRVTLPDRVASFYLDMQGKWGLRPLTGIASSPLLGEAGAIRSGDGYDAGSGLYLERVPHVAVSADPLRREAEQALARLRTCFRTFPFADAVTCLETRSGLAVVDKKASPGQDESAALTALMTGVTRASLGLAPGIMIRAPALSGAATGKGLLARCICAVAFGSAPSAITAGHDRQELEKRIGAALLEAGPSLLLDNLNNISLKSDTLASALTERPARIRVMGTSRTAMLNATAMIFITGNGLTVSEDLARRFMTVNLDAHMENPEARDFSGDLLFEVQRNRAALLADALTIWRWGRMQGAALPKGRPLGSFTQWARWCRDPLIALGCRDVAERVSEAKMNDPRRRAVVESLAQWWEAHNDSPVKVSELAPSVTSALDPQGRGRQFLASRVANLVGTQIAGFTLSRSSSESNWGVSTYALRVADPSAADRAAASVREGKESGDDEGFAEL